MSDLAIFLNTKIDRHDPNYLASIGDLCLTPIRQIFSGRTVCVVDPGSFVDPRQPITRGFAKVLKIIAAIVFLIPGLCLGSIFKGLSYLSPKTREYHRIVRQSLYPPAVFSDRTIGSPTNPLNMEGIWKAIGDLQNEQGQIGALIIYAVRGTMLIADSERYGSLAISALNPKKIILVGTYIEHPRLTPSRYSHEELGFPLPLKERLMNSGDWLRAGEGALVQKEMRSVEEALADKPPKNPVTRQPYRVVYTVQSP